MAKTGDQLIADVQLTMTIPNNQVLLTDQRILDLANDETQSTLVPLILSLNQEYLVYLDESEQTVIDEPEYSIPYRSVGRILRELKVRQNSLVWNVEQIALEDAQILQYTAQRFCYYFINDKFRMVPTPKTNYTLMKWYPMRPGNLTKVEAAGLITNISGNTLTLSSVPDTFQPGVKVDFIKGKQGNSTITIDQTIDNVSGFQITVTDVPSKAEVGDYVAIAETSPVMQLPDEMFTYLVLLTAKRCMYAIGDYEGMRNVDEMIPEKRRAAEQILAPRNQGESIKIVNRNGLLRGRRNGFWRGVLR